MNLSKMAHLGLLLAGILCIFVVAEGQTYSPSTPAYYSPATKATPPPTPPKKSPSPPPPPPKMSPPPPPPPPPKKSPPPPPPKKSPPPPPPKKSPPPPPPKKSPPPPPPKKSPPPPPPKKSPPPPPPKKSPPPPKKSPPSPPNSVPPPPPTYYSPPPPVVTTPPPVVTTPPPYVHKPPPPPTTYTPPPPVVTTPPPPSYTPPPVVTTPPPPSPTYYSPPPPVVTTPPPPPPTSYTPPPPVVATPPPSSEVAAKIARCRNKNYRDCYFRPLTCPADCPHTCEVDCRTCSPVCNCNFPGAVCQDPRFIGADGITFYFHGKKDQDFCLVTDPNLHINAHFIGKRNPKMGRDFTWVQSLGILFDDHELYVGARKTGTWNDVVDRLDLSFDGKPVLLRDVQGAKWDYTSAGVHITRSSDANSVVIEAEGKFKIKAVVVPITKKESLIHKYDINHEEDSFAHLDLSFKFYSFTGQVNGVLGQTYANDYVSNVKVGVAMPVVGGERKFLTSSLFATDCLVSRFVGQSEDSDDSNNVEFADFKCASGINGSGVVCKR